MSNLAAVFCVLLTIQCIDYSRADHFDECDGVEDETFVASWDSCKSYIYCMGEDSLAGECDEGNYFDAEQTGCFDAADVYCALDEPEPEPQPQPEPEPEPEPATTASTTAVTTTQAESTLQPATAPPVIREICPNVDDPGQIVLMPNNESCSDYYLCYHGHAIEMQCTSHLHFNANTGKCDFPEKVQCAIDRPHANKCLPHITDFFPHPEKCNYFYYCIKGFLTVQQCPFYYGWDVERRSCVQMAQAKCFHSANRI